MFAGYSAKYLTTIFTALAGDMLDLSWTFVESNTSEAMLDEFIFVHS